MAKYKNKKTSSKVKIIFGLILLIISLFISVAPELNLPFDVPAWDDIFKTIDVDRQTNIDKSKLNVHFIDVGQGDCILIQNEDTEILIDAGENGYGEKILKYLSDNNIDEIDLMVATHPHSDHIGGMDEVIDGIKVDSILMNEFNESNMPTTKTYRNLLEGVAENDIKVVELKDEKTIDYGDLKLTMFVPTKEYEDYNDVSIVIKIEYKSKSYLFTGDAEKEREYDMLNNGNDVSADILKIGHHGSTTSSSEKFIKAVNPSIGVIMCGEDNKYSHPHKEIVERYEGLWIDLYRTDYSGTIVISTDGSKFSISEEKISLNN